MNGRHAGGRRPPPRAWLRRPAPARCSLMLPESAYRSFPGRPAGGPLSSRVLVVYTLCSDNHSCLHCFIYSHNCLIVGRAGLARAQGNGWDRLGACMGMARQTDRQTAAGDRHVSTRIGTGARRAGRRLRPAPRGRRGTGWDRPSRPNHAVWASVSAADDEQSTRQSAEQPRRDGTLAGPRVAQQLRRHRMAGPGRTRLRLQLQPQQQARPAAPRRRFHRRRLRQIKSIGGGFVLRAAMRPGP